MEKLRRVHVFMFFDIVASVPALYIAKKTIKTQQMEIGTQ